jgi:hypothetical protein
MRPAESTCRRLLRSYAFNDLQDGWPMPGFAFKRPLQLVYDSFNFTHKSIRPAVNLGAKNERLFVEQRLKFLSQLFTFSIELCQRRSKGKIVVLIRIETSSTHFAPEPLIHFAQLLSETRSPGLL